MTTTYHTDAANARKRRSCVVRPLAPPAAWNGYIGRRPVGSPLNEGYALSYRASRDVRTVTRRPTARASSRLEDGSKPRIDRPAYPVPGSNLCRHCNSVHSPVRRRATHRGRGRRRLYDPDRWRGMTSPTGVWRLRHNAELTRTFGDETG